MIEPMARLIGMTCVGNGDPLQLPRLVTKQSLAPACGFGHVSGHNDCSRLSNTEST